MIEERKKSELDFQKLSLTTVVPPPKRPGPAPAPPKKPAPSTPASPGKKDVENRFVGLGRAIIDEDALDED